ncbi:MAG: Stp1/IreP family PP2C-type Ser/Thr phosphatase [Clostridiales bacterium]|nr:Stp1/IreP family PP2C-type Ser/Thr phosphatase [Clostridiales bacterium]
MKYAVKTDIGKRIHNEDSFLLPEKSDYPMLFAVADGMGGHAAGAVASSALIDELKAFDQKIEPGRELEQLRQAVENANFGVYQKSEEDRSLHGMGTTLVAALLLGTKYIAANVGDSRMYCFDGTSLDTVTTDHSLVEQLVLAGAITKEEARVHPQRNIITRAVGVSPVVEPDLFERDWQAGDILVLCSDGLHGAVEEDDIVSVLGSDRSLESMCDILVQLALDNGGTDNITLILIQLEEGDAA